MSGGPLVSVLTPTLNAARYLSETIQSLRDQSYGNIEHVFVDGGSTDGTLELIREYAETHHVRWVSEPDSGTSEACNRAVEMARGEFIVFISADDLFFPWAIEAAVEAFQAHPEVDVVYGDRIVFWNDIRQPSPTLTFLPHPGASRLKHMYPVPFWSFMRRHVYVDVGGCDTSLRYHNDHEFCHRLAQNATCTKIDEFFYVCRKHLTQASRVERTNLEQEKAKVQIAVDDLSRSAAKWKRRWLRVSSLVYGHVALLRFLYRSILIDRFGRVPSEAWPWRHFLAEHRIELRPWRRLLSRLIPMSKSYECRLNFSCMDPASRESPFAVGWQTHDLIDSAR